MPVDAVQLAHQGNAEVHHDANVRVLPLQVLRDRALRTGAAGPLPRLPACTGCQAARRLGREVLCPSLIGRAWDLLNPPSGGLGREATSSVPGSQSLRGC